MGALRATWHVLPRPGGRGTLPGADIAGPGLDAFARALVDTLAGDAFDAFCDYVAARNASLNAEGDEYYADRAEDAWEALEPELPKVLRLGVAEAQLIAHGIDHAVGRVGTAWEAA